MQQRYVEVSRREDEIARQIVDSAYCVHRHLGPGLLESVYETCFCHELDKRQIAFQRQVVVPVSYDGLKFDEGFRLDVVVDDLVICELKAVTELHDIYFAQMLTYMRLTGKRLGFLINFNVAAIKDGIHRMVV